MIKTALKKLYEGSIVNVTLLVSALEEEGISPIIKDRSQSALVAGFAAEISMQQEVFVYEDQWEKSKNILDQLDL